MFERLKKVPAGAHTYPWMIVGAAVTLAGVVIAMAVFNEHREERAMVRILQDKGAALIRAFEAGARTGMMGHMGSGTQVQTLLEETARQEGIHYLVLADSGGRILAHSDRKRIGSQLMSGENFNALSPDEEESSRIVRMADGATSFEVYRKFAPLRGSNSGHHWMGQMKMRRGMGGEGFWCAGPMQWPRRLQPGAESGESAVIFIGMDVQPFEEARAQDFRVTLITSAVLLALGFGGLVSVYWAQSYSTSRRLLQDTRALAAEVISSLPAGLVVLDASGRVSFVNQAAGEILGCSQDEVLGEPAGTVFPEVLRAFLREQMGSTDPVERELEMPVAAGGRVPLSVNLSRIITDEGNRVGSVLILRDLSEVRQLQEEVKRREKLAAVGRLAAGVAHEIRNPLSSIKGYATYFGSLFDEGSENRESADIMVREVDRLNRVITELLEYSKPLEIKPVSTDLAALVDHSLKLVREDAKAAGIDVAFDNSGPVMAELDPDRISQALLNLCLNAIQAMETGGRLEVGISDAEPGFVRVAVRDTGPGIPAESRAKVFEPYFTTKHNGTGLGLAIVQKITEAHGGSVELSDTSGNGSEFIMALPTHSERGQAA